MGKNSDFIHSYVPWVSFQRDGFKYHLKYKEKVSLKSFPNDSGNTAASKY